MVHDIERKTAHLDAVPATIEHELELAWRLLQQGRHSRDTLYRLHAPEAECISKGKAHKRYEFGVVSSLRTAFILAARALPGYHYDGHSMIWSLAHTKQNTGVSIRTAVADQGYHEHGNRWPGIEVFLPGQRSRSESERRTRRRKLRRRSVIEALIGHMKNEGLLARNWLKGSDGDAMHVALCAAGMNRRLSLRAISKLFVAGNIEAVLRLIESFLLPNRAVLQVQSAQRNSSGPTKYPRYGYPDFVSD